MDLSEELKDVVVIYHAHCQDGFGSAFAAYKKFGDSASYIPCSDRVTPPEDLINKEVYILDFSYPKEVLLSLEKDNKKLVVIDHHISAQESVSNVKEHIFSLENSAAHLSWKYFVNENIPRLIDMLEIIDLAKDKDESKANPITYILSKPYTFEAYESLLNDFSTEEGLKHVELIGKAQHDYLEIILESMTEKPDFVEFEGHTIACVNTSLPINEKSILLRHLYNKYPPFAMSYRFDNGLLKVSLRGNGEVDLTVLAGKYGGGGHKNAAGFIIKADFPLPFAKSVE